MTELLIVRHGQSMANIERVFAGHTNAPLSALGRLQAEKTAEYIISNYKVDKVYSSDLDRAYYTGKAVADKLTLPIIPSINLREIYAGDWENRKFTDIQSCFPTSYEAWLHDIGNAVCDGGESVSSLQIRIVNEIERIASENEGNTVVIATHATPIRALTCYCNDLPLSEMKNIPWVSNASITVATYSGGKLKIDISGYDAHLGEIASRLPSNV